MTDDQIYGDQFPPIEPLTRREQEILFFLADRLSNQEIAERLTLAISSVKWYTQQIFRKLNAENRRQAVLRAQDLGILESERKLPSITHNLPASLTPFVGREGELHKIAQMLQDPSCRLLTLAGPGGIGKTTLVIQAAFNLINENQSHFKDGIFFISLALVDDPTLIVPAIARSLGFTFHAHGKEHRNQLIRYLRPKQMLLILDNYEQLIMEEGVNLIVDLLEAAPGIKVLVTSRARLNILGEQLLQVEGMEVPEAKPMPAGETPFDLVNSYSSLQFFRQCARRVQPDFELNSGNIAAVTRICQVTQGMPLSILLAAAWLSVLKPEEIAAEVDHNLDMFEANLPGLPQRQHKIRSVFDASRRLLSGPERTAVQALSAFRGSFDREAAETVGDISTQSLLGLIDKCWLQGQADGRYQMHELLRQYANEYLKNDEARWVEAYDRHCAFYCAYLHQRQADLKGPRQRKALEEISQEIGNIQVAWQWAIDQGHIQQIDQGLESLCSYYRWHGLFTDGEAACSIAGEKIAKLMTQPGLVEKDLLRIQANILFWQSGFTKEHKVALELLQQAKDSLDLLESSSQGQIHEQAHMRVMILLSMGHHSSELNREEAWEMYSQALKLSQDHNDERGIAEALFGLGGLNWAVGEYEQAKEFVGQSLTIQGRLGDRGRMADSLSLLGLIYKHIDKLEQAETLHRESLGIYLETGSRWEVAEALCVLSFTLTNRGKPDEGLVIAQESLSIYRDLGDEYTWGSNAVDPLAFAALHSGQYTMTSAYAQQYLEVFRARGDFQATGVLLMAYGNALIAQGRIYSALEALHESAVIFNQIKQNLIGMAFASQAYAARLLGQPDLAQYYAFQAVDISKKIKIIFGLVSALPIIALLAADGGEIEWAVEVYALACTHPFVANSVWFEDVAGKQIYSSAATLPPEAVAAAQVRGRSQNMWEFARNWVDDQRECTSFSLRPNLPGRNLRQTGLRSAHPPVPVRR